MTNAGSTGFKDAEVTLASVSDSGSTSPTQTKAIGIGVLLALLAIITGAMLWQYEESATRLRAEASEQAQRRGQQVVSATTTAATILFKTIDVTSKELAQLFAPNNLSAFNKQVDQAINRLPTGSVLQVAVIDASGHLQYSNLGMTEKMYLGDREHFKVHLDSETDRLFISKPVLGRVSKQWSIQFSRPIRIASKFSGVLVMSVSPTYLQQALSSIALDSDDSITVLRSTGEILARNRAMEESLGKSDIASRPFLGADALKAGAYEGRSVIDEVDRLFHWQRVADHPVVVLLGLSKATAYEPVERDITEDRLKTFTGVAVLWGAALGIFALAWNLNIQGKNRSAMEHLAMNDALTGLRSRHALMRHLEGAISEAESKNGTIGVLYLDLNGFKPINDRLGHAAGDEALQAVSARIQGAIRAGDVAARIGGDEFVVVLFPLEHSEDLYNLRQRIDAQLRAPISIRGTTVQIGASIGCALYPQQGTTADELLAHADKEMYLRKHSKSTDLALAPA